MTKSNLAAVASAAPPEPPSLSRLRELNRTIRAAEQRLTEPKAKLAELLKLLDGARASSDRLTALQVRRREHEVAKLLDKPVDEAEVARLAAEIAAATRTAEADRGHLEAVQIAADQVQAKVDAIQRELNSLGLQRPALVRAALLEEGAAREAEFNAAARAFAKAISKRLLPYVGADLVLQQYPTVGGTPLTMHMERVFTFPIPLTQFSPGTQPASAQSGELDPDLTQAAAQLVNEWRQLA